MKSYQLEKENIFNKITLILSSLNWNQFLDEYIKQYIKNDKADEYEATINTNLADYLDFLDDVKRELLANPDIHNRDDLIAYLKERLPNLLNTLAYFLNTNIYSLIEVLIN